MISLRKPLGSLESPAASGAGLSPLVDMVDGYKRSSVQSSRDNLALTHKDLSFLVGI
jgi:hypothetical protein